MPTKRAQVQDEFETIEAKRTAPNKIKFTEAVLNEKISKRPHRQETIWDAKQDGLCVLVSRGPKGKRQATVTFRVCYYLKPGKPEYVKLGRYPDGSYTYPYKNAKTGRDTVVSCSDIGAMRRAASDIRNRAKDQGIDPRRPVASDVFADVVKEFIELYAKPNNRSWKETERIFNTYVLPEWGNEKIGDIKRGKHIIALLDQIAAKKLTGKGDNKGRKLGGMVTADAVLAQLSVLFNWHAKRDENFASPLVKKMRRAKPIKERARQRVLTDAELRAMWPILGELGTYGAAVKCILLTAQRARKVAVMRRADVKDYLVIPSHQKGDDLIPEQRIPNVWDVAREDDPKNKKVSVVPLSRLARQIIDAVPIVDADQAQDFVFSLDGRKPLNSWSKNKKKLDELMREALPDLPPWQLRDLRRTARTLMSRAGVQTEVSERALGHVMTTIRGTYDRYDYLPQKREAFDKLAAWIERIVNPLPSNIPDLNERRRGRRRDTASPSLPPSA